MSDGPPPRRGRGGNRRRAPPAAGEGRDARVTSPFRGGCRARPPHRAAADRGSSGGRSGPVPRARAGANPRASSSRSTTVGSGPATVDWCMSMSEMSTWCRRVRRASSTQARTSSRRSQGSKRSGSGRAADHARRGRARSGRRPWPARGRAGSARRSCPGEGIAAYCQRGAGVMIALCPRTTSVSLHHDPQGWHGRLGCAHRIWRGRARFLQFVVGQHSRRGDRSGGGL